MPRGRPRKNTEQVLLKSADLIGWALGGLEREIAETRARLGTLTAQAAKLRERVGAAVTTRKAGKPATGTAAEEGTARERPRTRRRRQMSPEARKRMSEMMKQRWAERRKNSA